MLKLRFTPLLMLALLMAGVVVGAYGIHHLLQVLSCRNWPTVAGQVRDSSAKPINAQAPERKSHDNLIPQVVYEYKVDGRAYWSDAICNLKHHRFFGIADAYYAGNEEDVLRLLAEYPTDRKVTVYYNPLHPGEAILDPGLKLPNFLPFILGLLLVYSACHLYLFGNVFARYRDGHFPG